MVIIRRKFYRLIWYFVVNMFSPWDLLLFLFLFSSLPIPLLHALSDTFVYTYTRRFCCACISPAIFFRCHTACVCVCVLLCVYFVEAMLYMGKQADLRVCGSSSRKTIHTHTHSEEDDKIFKFNNWIFSGRFGWWRQFIHLIFHVEIDSRFFVLPSSVLIVPVYDEERPYEICFCF